MKPEDKGKITAAITAVTGLLLVGLLPMIAPTISLTTPIIGALNLGVLLGAGNLAVSYWTMKQHRILSK